MPCLEMKSMSFHNWFGYILLSFSFLDSGSIYTWGLNTEGQCGLDHGEEILEPTELPLKQRVISLSCGYYHSAFVTGNVFSYISMFPFKSGCLYSTRRISEAFIGPKKLVLLIKSSTYSNEITQIQKIGRNGCTL